RGVGPGHSPCPAPLLVSFRQQTTHTALLPFLPATRTRVAAFSMVGASAVTFLPSGHPSLRVGDGGKSPRPEAAGALLGGEAGNPWLTFGGSAATRRGGQERNRSATDFWSPPTLFCRRKSHDATHALRCAAGGVPARGRCRLVPVPPREGVYRRC